MRPDERLSESQIAISSNLEGRSGIIEVPSKAAVGGEFSQERNLRLEDPTTVRRVKSLTSNVVKYDDGFKENVMANEVLSEEYARRERQRETTLTKIKVPSLRGLLSFLHDSI